MMAAGFAVTEEPGTDRFARRFHQAGFGMLAFDYRRLGESAGRPRQVVRFADELADWHAAPGQAATLPGRIYLDGTRADHIRIIFGCGRIVVPCRFRGTLRPSGRVECIVAVQTACGEAISLTEPARNAIAGKRAAGEAPAGQRPQSVCMDGCL